MNRQYATHNVNECVKFIDSDWYGVILYVIPNFEESGETGYAVEMTVESIQDGALPVETIHGVFLEKAPVMCEKCKVNPPASQVDIPINDSIHSYLVCSECAYHLQLANYPNIIILPLGGCGAAEQKKGLSYRSACEAD